MRPLLARPRAGVHSTDHDIPKALSELYVVAISKRTLPDLPIVSSLYPFGREDLSIVYLRYYLTGSNYI
jgi:hypothetical protein